MSEPSPRQLSQLDPRNLPQHISIIMDGNGRWAAERHLPRIEGHRKGIQSVRKIITFAREIGIKILTLYAFSNENWSRPAIEISTLMILLEKYLKKELKTLLENGIRFKAIGQVDRLPEEVVALIQKVEKKTSSNQGMLLVLALSYGGRTEIIDAIKQVAQDVKDEKIALKEIDENQISNYLYTRGLPDPDLMIRTGGEVRISNFLPWQQVYTELHFTKTFWPDFKEEDFLTAILDYQARNRRFGLVAEQVENRPAFPSPPPTRTSR